MPVPIEDPNYDRLPWAKTGLLAWGLLLSVGSMAACYVFGAIYSFFAARNSAAARHRQAGTDASPSFWGYSRLSDLDILYIYIYPS